MTIIFFFLMLVFNEYIIVLFRLEKKRRVLLRYKYSKYRTYKKAKWLYYNFLFQDFFTSEIKQFSREELKINNVYFCFILLIHLGNEIKIHIRNWLNTFTLTFWAVRYFKPLYLSLYRRRSRIFFSTYSDNILVLFFKPNSRFN